MSRTEQAPAEAMGCRELTTRMRRGDEAVWEAFHARYFDFLVRYARHRGARGGDVEDLVQATYLRILRHVKPMEEWSALEGWLRCLMRCEVIDFGRRGARRLALLEKFAHWQEERRSEPEGRAADGRLEELLEALSQEERRLVMRCYVEGWTHQELAREARSTPKAIESKLARLRNRMRECAVTTV